MVECDGSEEYMHRGEENMQRGGDGMHCPVRILQHRSRTVNGCRSENGSH